MLLVTLITLLLEVILMVCHHYCNDTLRCPTCINQFYAWAQARTNAPPRKGQVHNFYAHVNVISPPIFVGEPVQTRADRGRV